jgi:YHS domain-containing protein
MNRIFAAVLLGAAAFLLPPAPAADQGAGQIAKEALQALNDFIGGWKGNGSVEKDARATWKETVRWSWRFKGDDAWLVLEIAGGKYLTGGELRYLVDQKRYQLTARDKDGKKVVYEGELKKGRLILERLDPKTRETQQLKMNLAGGGIRFIYALAHRPANRTLFTNDFQVACTKEGETFGAKEHKNECVVSGGLGTMAVSHKGETYWVCCSGCRDAFNENPEKYIAEYKAKKAGKK